MAGLEVVVEVDKGKGGGDTELAAFRRRLKGMTDRSENLTPALVKIHESFLRTERGLFSSQGGKNRWAPLTARYQARKARQGFDPRLMRRTGELAAALTRGEGPGAVAEFTPEGVLMGTNLKQAVFAHRGSGRRRRRLLRYDAERRNRWTRIIRDHLLDAQGTSSDD